MAVVVGVPGFVGFVALIASHQRKMKTLAIREQELAVGGDAATLGPAVDALYTEFDDMRSRVAELQERLDFAEGNGGGGVLLLDADRARIVTGHDATRVGRDSVTGAAGFTAWV